MKFNLQAFTNIKTSSSGEDSVCQTRYSHFEKERGKKNGYQTTCEHSRLSLLGKYAEEGRRRTGFVSNSLK